VPTLINFWAATGGCPYKTMTEHWFFWIFVAAFILHELVDYTLTYLNISNIKKHAGEIPDFFKGKINAEEYQKSVHYTLDKSKFGIVTSLIKIPLIWFVIWFGALSHVDTFLNHHLNSSTLTYSVVYCLIVALALLLVQIPISLYSNFVLEEKYGFNKMTYKTYVVDLIKTIVISSALGVPLLYLVFWLYNQAGTFWWLWAFFALFGFELFIAAIYPILLAPIFNKFTPLADGELKESIYNIAKKIKFKMSGIYTIDGSKRSSHSNAYFAGMGKMRRIVLFDTLMKTMNTSEITAVLAHEMGHNIKKHVQKFLILSFITTLISFWVLSLLMNWEPLFTTFGAGIPSPHKALIIFALFSGYFTFWMTPFTNLLSRKHEFEADRFSVETTNDANSMKSALLKLSRENLSNLTPHPLYSFYHYSHPTTVERIKAVEAVS